jgi:F0F1-type ATP synthase assembly protein I
LTEEKSEKKYNWQQTVWVLAVGGQAGLLLAFPVLFGLVAGYLLDRNLGTLPIVTLILTLVGMVSGPILVYRWVRTNVQRRLKGNNEGGDKEEELRHE